MALQYIFLIPHSPEILPKIDCKWTEFENWSECNVTCGGGNHVRRRTKKQLAANGGKECIGDSLETKSCATNPCKGKLS